MATVFAGIFDVCILLLIGFVIWQQERTIKDLANRLMARNYGDLVQGELLKKVEIKPGLDVKVKEQDNEPDSVEVLNQLL